MDIKENNLSLQKEEKNGEGTVLGNAHYSSRKNRKKIILVICQIIILGLIGYGVATLFLTFNTYQPYDDQAHNLSSDNGFIAISYIGAQRLTTHNLFGRSLLHQHLKALKDLGYVTITQQDIIDYYNLGKPLPEKA